MKVAYNKLVRNAIPEIIKADNGTPIIKVLNKAEYKQALLQKLVEEANEVLASDGSVEELADVMQVLTDLQNELGISAAVIETARKTKEVNRGGFDQRIFLERVETDD